MTTSAEASGLPLARLAGVDDDIGVLPSVSRHRVRARLQTTHHIRNLGDFENQRLANQIGERDVRVGDRQGPVRNKRSF